MPILFSKHLCVSAALSLPRHSWRSDRHGESVGQQPWNKYGWSWVRWARIICFAICLCESVDVMTIVLPSPVSPQLLGRHLTDAHTFLRPTKSHTCKCMYTLIHTHTKTLFIVNCSHTSIYTQVHIYNSTAVASSISSGTKPWLLCVCFTALPILWASGPPCLLEMTSWQLPGRIGVGDCSVGTVLSCDSLLESLHEEQRGYCVRSTLAIEGNEKLHQSSNTGKPPPPASLSPKQTILFLPLDGFVAEGC